MQTQTAFFFFYKQWTGGALATFCVKFPKEKKEKHRSIQAYSPLYFCPSGISSCPETSAVFLCTSWMQLINCFLIEENHFIMWHFWIQQLTINQVCYTLVHVRTGAQSSKEHLHSTCHFLLGLLLGGFQTVKPVFWHKVDKRVQNLFCTHVILEVSAI